MKTLSHKNIAIAICSLMLALGVPAKHCYAQAQQGQAETATKVASLNEPGSDAAAGDVGGASVVTPSQTPAAVDAGSSAAIAKKLEVMELRIQQLEAQLGERTAAEHPPVADLLSADLAKDAAPAPAKTIGHFTVLPQTQSESAAQSATPAPQGPAEPFAYADWTWLNGNSREKDKPWDSKFFTPEIRFDTNYVFDFNHPRDDTMGGSTEIFRSMEVQVEQLSFGGDFHWNNVRGRILTMNSAVASSDLRVDHDCRIQPLRHLQPGSDPVRDVVWRRCVQTGIGDRNHECRSPQRARPAG
ncbi:MAG TPA: hypothetical protein VII29_13575 [Terriglobales bacterium]